MSGDAFHGYPLANHYEHLFGINFPIGWRLIEVHRNGVSQIFGAINPFQIIGVIINFIPVFVINLIAPRAARAERQSDELVDKDVFGSWFFASLGIPFAEPFIGKADICAPTVNVVVLLYNARSLPHAPIVADFVKALE